MLRHKEEQYNYLQSFREVNMLLHAVCLNPHIPIVLKQEIEKWQKVWERTDSSRPMTAPIKRSAFRRPENDVIENLRAELKKVKSNSCCIVHCYYIVALVFITLLH